MAPSAEDLLEQDEFWVFSFILGWALFNWPLLTLTVRKNPFDIPLILVYLTVIWLLIILLLYQFDRGYSDRGYSNKGDKD